MTNIVKHAKAKTVDLLLYQDNGLLFLSIQDDGRGMDSKKSRLRKQESSGMGLASIERRIAYLGGKLQIKSDENGTEILASIPL